MNWKEYCECLRVYQLEFGFAPTREKIEQGFLYWRQCGKADLIHFIKVKREQDLSKLYVPPQPIKERLYKHEEVPVSDDYLSQYLNEIGATSLLDAVRKSVVKKQS